MNEATIPCPEALRLAFQELLRTTLLSIRSHSSDPKLVFALADHAHNIPPLLSSFMPDQLRYYWEIEVPSFLNSVPPDHSAAKMFRSHWVVIEQEYWRICFPPADSQGDD